MTCVCGVERGHFAPQHAGFPCLAHGGQRCEREHIGVRKKTVEPGLDGMVPRGPVPRSGTGQVHLFG